MHLFIDHKKIVKKLSFFILNDVNFIVTSNNAQLLSFFQKSKILFKV